MNALLKLVAFSFFTLFANVSFAAWEELGSNDFMTVLIDKSSIKKSGDKVQVLSMLDLKKPGVVAPGFFVRSGRAISLRWRSSLSVCRLRRRR